MSVDDARIDEIRRAVMSRLGGSPEDRPATSLEARISALEAALASLPRGGPAISVPTAAPARGRIHPSLVVVTLPPDSDACLAEPGRCVMEPDQPCTRSHACRTFGH